MLSCLFNLRRSVAKTLQKSNVFKRRPFAPRTLFDLESIDISQLWNGSIVHQVPPLHTRAIRSLLSPVLLNLFPSFR